MIGIVPASDTGAVEMALWSLLGARPVTVMAWESFGLGWVTDLTKQLPLDVQTRIADYGVLPNLDTIPKEHDIVFTWNGTTSGVAVPNGDWIANDRAGLTICDATSAVFAYDLPWEKLDVCTFSWQKTLGGEAGHGMLILSPRAVERLESYTPDWPLPKLFRMTKNGKLNAGIFKGETINTPSMLCVEDYLVALDWVERIGGLSAMIERARKNMGLLQSWVDTRDWIANMAKSEDTRSVTSVCLEIVDPWFKDLSAEDQNGVVKDMVTLLEDQKVAYDIKGHRDAPANIRIWCGGTVELGDLELLTPWLDWAWDRIKRKGLSDGI